MYDDSDRVSVKYAVLKGLDINDRSADLVANFNTVIALDTRVFVPMNVTSEDLEVLLVSHPGNESLYLFGVSLDTTIPITPKYSDITIPVNVTNINTTAFKKYIDWIPSERLKLKKDESRLFLRGIIRVKIFNIFRTSYQINLDITHKLFPSNIGIDSSCTDYSLHLSAREQSSNSYLSDYSIAYDLKVPNSSILRVGDPNMLVQMSFFTADEFEDKLLTLIYKPGNNSFSLPCNILKSGVPGTDDSLSATYVQDEKLINILNSTSDKTELIVKDFAVSYLGNTEIASWMDIFIDGLLIHIMAKIDRADLARPYVIV